MIFSQLNTNRKGLFNLGISPKLTLTLAKCWYINALNEAFMTSLVSFLEMRVRMIDNSSILSRNEKSLFDSIIQKHLNLRYRLQKCIVKWMNFKRNKYNIIINKCDFRHLQEFQSNDERIIIFDKKGYFQFRPAEMVGLYLQSIHESYKKGIHCCIVKNPYTINNFNISQHFYIFEELRKTNVKIPPLLLDFFFNADRYDYFLARNCYYLEEKFRYDFFYSASAYSFLDFAFVFLSKHCTQRTQRISREKLFKLDANIVRRNLIHMMVHDHMQGFMNPLYRMNIYPNICNNIVQFIYDYQLLE